MKIQPPFDHFEIWSGACPVSTSGFGFTPYAEPCLAKGHFRVLQNTHQLRCLRPDVLRRPELGAMLLDGICPFHHCPGSTSIGRSSRADSVYTT